MTVSSHPARQGEDFSGTACRIGAAVEQGLKAKGVMISSLSTSVHRPVLNEDPVLHVDVMLTGSFELPIVLAHWALHDQNFDMAVDSLVKAVTRSVALQSRIDAFLSFAQERAKHHLGSTTARLLRVALARIDASDPPRIREIMVETIVEGLDAALRTVPMTMQNRRRVGLVKDLRSRAATQLLRQRQLDRLTRLGAVVEVSAPAEAVIAERGLNVGRVAADLLGVDPDASGLRSSSAAGLEGLMVYDGLIQFFGDVGPIVNVASLLGDQLRIFERIPAERRAELLGQPAADLFDHPAIRASGRIASIRLDESATDTRFRGVRRRALRIADIDGYQAAA